MAMSASQNLKKYEALALKLLRKELGSYVEKVTARIDFDFADEETIFFVAHLNNDAPTKLGRDFVSAHRLLRHELEKLDEYRFPYLDTQRPVGFRRSAETILKTSRGEGSLSKRSEAR
jgi:hypothetical protein